MQSADECFGWNEWMHRHEFITMKRQRIEPILIRKRMHFLTVRYSSKTNQLIIEMKQLNADLTILIFRNQTNEPKVEMTTAMCWQNGKLTF